MELLVVVGATALAAELAALAKLAGLRVVVVGRRPSYATRKRIPDAHEIVRASPEEYLPGVLSALTPIVVLSHDARFDLPALRCALDSEAPYIGLVGGRRSQAALRAALRAHGFSERALARISSPAGLETGSVTIAQMAASILAEVVFACSREESAGLPASNLKVETIVQRSAP